MENQELWENTEHLMTFVKGGVVPRVYEYKNIGYPAWEKYGNPSNVWLISQELLNENEDHRGSYPHLRAQRNGYYIYGFRHNLTMDGQAQGEFFRYLSQRDRSKPEWNIYDLEGNLLYESTTKKTATKKKMSLSSNASAVPVIRFDFNFWNNKTESEVSDYLLDRVKRIYNDAKERVPRANPKAKVVGNIPILWFGDYNAYKNSDIKVVTVGLNPSDEEFTEERFPSLSKKNINDINVNEYFCALNNYFVTNPYWDKWFRSYNEKLSPWDAGYRDMTNTTLHIDCWSPCATYPVWNKLETAQNELKAIQRDMKTGNDIFIDLVNFLKPDILLIPDTYWKNFQTPDFREIIEMRDRFQDKIAQDNRNNTWAALHFYKSRTLSVISGPNRTIPFSSIATDETLRLFNVFVDQHFNSENRKK